MQLQVQSRKKYHRCNIKSKSSAKEVDLCRRRRSCGGDVAVVDVVGV